jgi:hypothetical protein
MSGFGVVHPLPGIADGVELNSSITLPIGIEAYSAYAFGTWLSTKPMRREARRFAMVSAVIAQGLGLAGQIIYHVLTAQGYHQAPLFVVGFVSCLPVLVFFAAAVLHHLTRDAGVDEAKPANTEAPAIADVLPQPTWPGKWLAAEGQTALPGPVTPVGEKLSADGVTPSERTGTDDTTGRGRTGGIDVSDLLEAGRQVAADLGQKGESLTRRALATELRDRGLSCGNERASELLRALRSEAGDHVGQLEAVS